MTRESVIRPQRVAHEFQIGDKALVYDDRGRVAAKVEIASELMKDKALGWFYVCKEHWPKHGTVDCNFGELHACNDRWRRLDMHADLRPAKETTFDVAELPDGKKVYAPKPFRAARPVKHPPAIEQFMDAFDREEAHALPPLPMDRLRPDQLAAYDDAARKSVSPHSHERREARGVLAKLHRDFAAEQARHEVDRGIVETIAAARRRDDPMRVSNGQIRRGDGLDSLLQSGAIDALEHVAGLKYRDVFDAALTPVRLTANYGETGGGSAPNPEHERIVRLRRLAKDQALSALHGYVQAQVRSPRAIPVLRLIAGEGRLVSHFSKGASRAKNVEALKGALEALADKWGLK